MRHRPLSEVVLWAKRDAEANEPRTLARVRAEHRARLKERVRRKILYGADVC